MPYLWFNTSARGLACAKIRPDRIGPFLIRLLQVSRPARPKSKSPPPAPAPRPYVACSPSPQARRQRVWSRLRERGIRRSGQFPPLFGRPCIARLCLQYLMSRMLGNCGKAKLKLRNQYSLTEHGTGLQQLCSPACLRIFCNSLIRQSYKRGECRARAHTHTHTDTHTQYTVSLGRNSPD